MFLRRRTAKVANFLKPLIGLWWATHWCWLHQHPVAASSDALSCPAFDIRMLGGSTEFDGLIIVKDVAGNWSRLCYGYNFDALLDRGIVGTARIAEVVCRQLGIKDAKPSAVLYDYEHSPLTQNYSGYVFPYDLKCVGWESHLSECHPYFRDFKDVLALPVFKKELSRFGCLYGVACRDDPAFSVSLEPKSWSQMGESLPSGAGSSDAIGLLRGSTFGRKGYVCASWADTVNRARIAQVACRQMGYSTGLSLRLSMPEAEKLGSDIEARFKNGNMTNRTCLMPDTTCSGNETSISECEHWRTWGTLETIGANEMIRPGHQVPVQCLSDHDSAFEIKLGQQIEGHSESPEGVFIRYGSLWLPLVNATNPYTCSAVCRSLHNSRPVKAICYTEELNETAETGNEDIHTSFVQCNRNQMDIKKCTHSLDSKSARGDDESPLEHLQARCILPPENQVSNTSPRLAKLVDADGTRSGCLMVYLDNDWYQAGALDEEEATKVAVAACNYLHYNRTVQFASGHIMTELDTVTCPSARVIVGCGPSDSSITTCAYQKLSTGVPLGIRAFCGVGDMFKLALTTGFTKADGRLELLHGDIQGFVGDISWNNVAAAVACRELGLNGTGARAILKTINIHGEKWMLEDVECTGKESSLMDCKHRWVLSSFPLYPAEVGGVVCGGYNPIRMEFLNYTANPGYPALRIDGRLTYFCFTNTHTDAFTSAYLAAELIMCKAAGFGRVKHAIRSMTSYEGKALEPGAKAFKNFMCKNKVISLEECTYEDVVLANECPERSPSTNAWKKILTLQCENYQIGTAVRLVGGASPYEGRVEVMYKGEWGAVCDDRFESTAASVVCSQLFGTSSIGTAVPGYRFSTGNEKFLLDDVQCSKNSKTLAECSHSAWGDHDCGPCEMAGVRCRKVPFIRQPIVTMTMKEKKLRLACSAEADPPAEYLWLSSGGTISAVADNSIEVQCLESEHAIYTCNAANTVDEKTTQVVIGPDISCYAKRMYISEYSSSMGTAGVTAMAVALCLMTLAFLVIFLYAIYIRRALRKATPSSKIQSNISYLNPNFTSMGPS